MKSSVKTRRLLLNWVSFRREEKKSVESIKLKPPFCFVFLSFSRLRDRLTSVFISERVFFPFFFKKKTAEEKKTSKGFEKFQSNFRLKARKILRKGNRKVYCRRKGRRTSRHWHFRLSGNANCLRASPGNLQSVNTRKPVFFFFALTKNRQFKVTFGKKKSERNEFKPATTFNHRS